VTPVSADDFCERFDIAGHHRITSSGRRVSQLVKRARDLLIALLEAAHHPSDRIAGDTRRACVTKDESFPKSLDKGGIHWETRDTHSRVVELEVKEAAERSGVLILLSARHLQLLHLQKVGDLSRRLRRYWRIGRRAELADQGHPKSAGRAQPAPGWRSARRDHLPSGGQACAPNRGFDQVELPVVGQLLGRLGLQREADILGGEAQALGPRSSVDADVQVDRGVHDSAATAG
jgi:hypothetical protein